MGQLATQWATGGQDATMAQVTSEQGQGRPRRRGLDFGEQLPLNDVVLRVEDQMVRADLTDKEKVVARLVLGGFSNKELADHTGNTEKTAKHHVHAVFSKFYVGSRAELAAKVFGYRQPQVRTT